MAGTDVLALTPARAGSKGIPGKNFKPLAGLSPTRRALACVAAVGCEGVLSTDADTFELCDVDVLVSGAYGCSWLPTVLSRPDALAQDDTPMIDVVQHALAEIPGPDNQIVLLVQPTQPLREPKHLTAAVALLRETQADSVVSVVELPQTHHPAAQFVIDHASLIPWRALPYVSPSDRWRLVPSRRQALEPTFVRDGTCYAFYRRTVATYGTIYGRHVAALVIPPEETCALDTMADWAEAERRLKEREG